MSDAIDNGGASFPSTRESTPGMTLRDWFAGQALAGICANPAYDAASYDKIAREAYSAADTMLKARKVQP